MGKNPVIALIKPDIKGGTTLWANRKVIAMFLADSDGVAVSPPGRLEVKLRRFCNHGFRIYLPNTIKLEYGKTYGIHIDQYRIVGFFANGYDDFVALDWFVKKTQRNDRRMTAIYQRVDEMREAKGWIKK